MALVIYKAEGDSRNMMGATADSAGSAGLVPAPAAGAQRKYLRGDATWADTVYGVKGGAETSYRTGQVNLTKANIGLDKVNNTADADKEVKNADTADKLTTARKIGGVSFDGSADIDLPGVNKAGNQSTTGNAATATKLKTARTLTIGSKGKTFDGSADVSYTLDEIGVAAKGHTHDAATTSANGFMSSADKTKLNGIATGAQVNVLESVKVNGTALTPTSKSVDVTVPTKTSELTNDSTYQTKTQVETLIATAISKSGHASFETADTVPAAADAKENVLYLVMNSTTDHYDIYALVSGAVVLIDDTTVDLSGYATTAAMTTALAKKVNVVTGKELSTNDFTSAYKEKLDGIAEGATQEEYTYGVDADGKWSLYRYNA